MIQKLDKVRVVKYEEKGFNYSKIINFGVKNCPDSEFVVQLNSDTELLTPNWLEKFIGYAQRKMSEQLEQDYIMKINQYNMQELE